MSARALIASGTIAGRFRAILALQDGHPGNEAEPRAGLVLRDQFNTPAKVDTLLALGDVRTITPEHGTPQPCPATLSGCSGSLSIFGQLTDVQAAAREAEAGWLYLWTGMQWLHMQLDLSVGLATYQGGDPYPMTPVTAH